MQLNSENFAPFGRLKLAGMHKMSLVGSVARIVLGGVFVYASIDKLAFPEEFELLIKGYRFVPDVFVPAIAFILPWVELFLGAFLVGGLYLKTTSRVAVAILSTFLIIICVRAASGAVGDCGCFGDSSFLSTSNIGIMVIRDLMFLSLAVLVLMSAKGKLVR